MTAKPEPTNDGRPRRPASGSNRAEQPKDKAMATEPETEMAAPPVAGARGPRGSKCSELPIVPVMETTPDPEAAAPTGAGGDDLPAAALAVIADLEQRIPEGMGPLERAQAARIRDAIARLANCAAQLTKEDLVVRGSTGQRRGHPLLKVEQELRNEILRELKELSFRADQRAMMERLNALHRARRLKNKKERS